MLKFEHIKRAKEINDFIFNNSEEMRKKRRTLNTQSLTGGVEAAFDLDGDGIIDDM